MIPGVVCCVVERWRKFLTKLLPSITINDQAALKQGNSGSKTVTSTETGNMHKYQTRVVSNANQVNLDFVDAKPVLEDQLAKSISGIL